VTHFNFWTKWPLPFLPILGELQEAGWPSLWNVTLTGLGGTSLEPHVPSTKRALKALLALSRQVGPKAVLWRFDPILLSDVLTPASTRERFCHLADSLSGHVDRVAVSFVTEYGRRVKPDLRAYFRETRTTPFSPGLIEQTELIQILNQEARARELTLTLCCTPELRARSNVPQAACNSWDWALRVYPALQGAVLQRPKPCRPDCACSREIDIGCYDICVLGCRYSYGSCREEIARRNFQAHDPQDPCLIPRSQPPIQESNKDVPDRL
jgi:hypothetical protein